MTRDSLREAFPSFENAPNDMVDAGIARAVLQVDPEVLGAQTDVAVLFLAAHEIAMDPHGQDLRLVSDDEASAYLARFTALTRAAGASWRTLG